MFAGAPPLLIAAQLVRLVMCGVIVASSRGGFHAPVWLSNAVLTGTAFLLDILGYLDLSYRVRGFARWLLRGLAVTPFLVVLATIAADLTAPAYRAGNAIAAFGPWLYAIELMLGVVALWLAAKRARVAIAIAALVATVRVMPGPQPLSHLTSAVANHLGAVGDTAILFGRALLIAVLAARAGRCSSAVTFDGAAASRTVRRGALGIVVLALLPIVELAGGGAVRIGALLGLVGFSILVGAAYRARAAFPRWATAAIALSIYAQLEVEALRAVYESDLSPAIDAATIAAIGALVVGLARVVKTRSVTGTAVVFGLLATTALVLHGTAAGQGCELAAELVAIVALRRGSRVLQTMLAPKIADVFD